MASTAKELKISKEWLDKNIDLDTQEKIKGLIDLGVSKENATAFAFMKSSKNKMAKLPESLKEFQESIDKIDEKEYSPYWGKEELKWFDHMENKLANLSTYVLWIRKWGADEDSFVKNRAKVLSEVKKMKDSSKDLSEIIDEISEFLEDTLSKRRAYVSR